MDITMITCQSESLNENNTKKFWQNTWKKHLETYFSTTSRTGIFIKHMFGHKIKSTLEIACGSSRDSIYLAQNGYFASASDYNNDMIKYLKNRFKIDNLKYITNDAFSLSLEENSFDLIFHNGFLIYFLEDEKIFQILKEQERVSRKYILIIVHNKLNENLITLFKKLSLNDKLYDIRFFEPDEFQRIVEDSKISYKKIIFFKFGGKMDRLYNKLIFKKIPNILYPFRTYIIPKLYQIQKWENTERVACLVELNK